MAKPEGPRATLGIRPKQGLTFVFGLGKTYWRSACFPFATFLEEFDALEALKDGTFAADGGAGLETVVL